MFQNIFSLVCTHRYTEEMLPDRKNGGKANTPEAWMDYLLLLLLLLVKAIE